MIYILVLIQVVLLVTGQTMWKMGLDKTGGLQLSSLTKVFTSPYIIGGLGIYAVATLLWFYILSKAKDQFSVVYPLGSLAYALGVVVALLIFKETIPFTRWIGVVLIITGCAFIAAK